MSDAMREAFEFSESDGGQWMRAVERSGESYKLASTSSSWKTWKRAYSIFDAKLAAAKARIAELEARCPVSCAKRGTPP